MNLPSSPFCFPPPWNHGYRDPKDNDAAATSQFCCPLVLQGARLRCCDIEVLAAGSVSILLLLGCQRISVSLPAIPVPRPISIPSSISSSPRPLSCLPALWRTAQLTPLSRVALGRETGAGIPNTCGWLTQCRCALPSPVSRAFYMTACR